MSKSPDTLSTELISHYKYINYTRKKMELLYTKKMIVRRDIEQVYTGLFLDTCTSFEMFIEALFLDLLVENKLDVKSSYVSPKVFFKSRKIAQEIVFGTQKYLDWFPYHLTEKRAEAFFRKGRPFTSINRDADKKQADIKNKQDKRTIEHVFIIRNAIAHNSDYSIKRFENELINNVTLPPREHTPSGFLRGKFRASPPQTRFEYFTLEISSIATKLCAQ